MVEFGAGGNIVHNLDTNTPANAAESVAAGEGGSGAANTSGVTEGTNPPTVPPPNPRRKRKAKGWFCPVCRQRQYFCFITKFATDMFDLTIRSLHVPFTHFYDAADEGLF